MAPQSESALDTPRSANIRLSAGGRGAWAETTAEASIVNVSFCSMAVTDASAIMAEVATEVTSFCPSIMGEAADVLLICPSIVVVAFGGSK
eukprot:9478144-Pyramimonas_sp.AAC.2